MEAEEARKRRDEEREEKRKKEARSRLSVRKGAGNLTSKAQSNSYAGFQYVIVNVPATVSEIVRGHCPLFSNIYECTLICQISSAQIFCDWSTLNIRFCERKIPDTMCVRNRGIYSCTRQQ